MFLQLLSFCSDENNSPSCDFPPEMFSNWLRSQEIGPFVFTANDDNDDDDDFGHDVDDDDEDDDNICRVCCIPQMNSIFFLDLTMLALPGHSVEFATLMLKTKECYYGLGSKGFCAEPCRPLY